MIALQKRERILAAVTGVFLLVLVVGFFFSRGGSSSLGDLRQRRNDLVDEVEKKRTLIQHSRKAANQLAAWQKGSLPSGREPGLLYQDWLRELVVRAKFRGAKVDPGQPQSQRGVYTKHPFTVTGGGTVDTLTAFLFDFYSAGHLHKVRRLTIRPIEGSQELKLTIHIEALALPGADREDKLSAEKGNRLALSKLEDYRRKIVRRRMEGERYAESGGLFAAYAPPAPRIDRAGPPSPPEPPKPPGFDLAKYTHFTGYTAVNGRPQAWLDCRPEGKLLKLYEGDPFEVGQVSGTVKHIEPRRVTLEIDGQPREIRLGDNLHQTAGDFDVEPSGGEVPETEEPGATEPGADQPEAEEPGTIEPGADQPEAEEPDTPEPEDVPPEAEEADTSTPLGDSAPSVR